MANSEYLLEAKNIVKKFGGVVALGGVSLNVKKGEILGLIGPNGSGKTTMFNLITGYIPLTEGGIFFQGESIHKDPTHIISRKGIARTFQHIELFRGLSVLNNIIVASQCREKAKTVSVLVGTSKIKSDEKRFKEKAEEILDFVGILQFKDYAANDLAYGQQRLVEIARALATDPELILLDEPAAGMNPTEKRKLSTLVRKIRKSGITVIIIDHDMKMVCSLADRITVLDCGLKIAEGCPLEIQNNETVITAYLGSSAQERKKKDKNKVKTVASGKTVLSLDKVNTYYGASHILKNISFTVKEGEFVTLIGANGAGKTTLLKTISGMLKPKIGTIKYYDSEITGHAPHILTKHGIVHVPEGRGIFPQLSVKENILMGAYLSNNKEEIEQDMKKVLELFPRLQERINQMGSSLSGGEQQMLAIARAMLSKPNLLLLDEPSMGLSPKFTEEVFDVISKIHQAGHTIVLVEQNAKVALSAADRGFVIEVGEIVIEGKANKLLNNPDVIKAYLGG